MNSLNIDCLMEIVKLLNLKDQISLCQVTSSTEAAVLSVWQRKCKRVQINFTTEPITNEEFRMLLKGVEKVVEILKIKFFNKEKYDILKQFCFERVTNFSFSLGAPYFIEDTDLIDLRKALPNLEKFTPHGNLTGLHIADWALLKNLNLNFCLKLRIVHFETIMNRLKLEKLVLNIFPINQQHEQINLQNALVENLKYLRINTYELYYFMSKPLPALKELIISNFYNARQIFEVLLSVWQPKDIRLVETSNIDNVLVSCLGMNMNVEELTIFNDGNPFPSNIIPSLHMLTDLRKLRFKNCFVKYSNFINILKNTLQLNEISFENCYFDITTIKIDINKIFPHREKSLRLNMFENRLIDRIIEDTWPLVNDEVTYVSVQITGNRNLLELVNLQTDDFSYEPLRIVFK